MIYKDVSCTVSLVLAIQNRNVKYSRPQLAHTSVNKRIVNKTIQLVMWNNTGCMELPELDTMTTEAVGSAIPEHGQDVMVLVWRTTVRVTVPDILVDKTKPWGRIRLSKPAMMEVRKENRVRNAHIEDASFISSTANEWVNCKGLLMSMCDRYGRRGTRIVLLIELLKEGMN